MAQDQAPVTQTKITIPSRLDHLRRVRDLIEHAALQTEFPEREVQRIVTAAFEAVTNAATHGSPLGEENQITVIAQVYPDRFVVEIHDQGNGIPKITLPEMPTTDSSRGRGIPLMRILMDQVKLSNDDGGRVVLTKFRKN